jgi:hypothetical protein
VAAWPQQHKTLALCVILFLVAVLAVSLLVLRPRAQEVATAREEMTTLHGELEKTGWPLDSERLTRLLEETQRRLEGPRGRTETDPRTAIGVRNRAEAVLRASTAMFDGRIKEFFGTPEDFVREVSRLDYQEEFNQLERRLHADDIILAEEMLGLGENTSSAFTYQLLLQIWTLDELLKLVTANRLRPVKDAKVTISTDTGRRQASKLTILPVRAYYLHMKDKEPYLLEMPVRMTLAGEANDVCGFLRALHGTGKFFPVSHLELSTENPALRRPGDDGVLRVGRVVVNIECSTFFRLRADTPVQKPTEMNTLPRGA